MVKKMKTITVQVGPNFFNNSFEPSRRKIEKQLGVKVGQAAFTEMLEKNKINLDVKLNKEFLNGKKSKGRKKK